MDKAKCHIHGLPYSYPTECGRCQGDGEIEDDESFAYHKPFVKCWECAGTGIGEPDCEMCLFGDDDD